ncbi:hypothetical protein K7432_009963 [Basidiobolus ranarum]|uniref:BHLH domain-containing protein n=1 Tax=Basidiobolus ranarum TaxID=34480 RepID=A0ABR2WPH9_9FUNG
MDKGNPEAPPFRIIDFNENSTTSQTRTQTTLMPGPMPPTVSVMQYTSQSISPTIPHAAQSYPLNSHPFCPPSNPGEGTSTIKKPVEPTPVEKKPSLTSHMANRRLKGYRFEDSIREFSPDKLFKNKENRRRESYVVNGVNILNRDEIDSQAAITRIQKRKEQHNRVERKRRDLINTAIEELSEIVPNAQEEGIKYARGNVLRLTIDYIKDLQTEIQGLRLENENLKHEHLVPRLDPAKRPPMITINHDQSRVTNNTTVINRDTEVKTPQDNFGFPVVNVSPSYANGPIGYGNVLGSPLHTPLLSSSQGSPITSPFHSPAHSPVSPRRPSETGFLLPPAAIGAPLPTEHIQHTERRYSDGLLSPYSMAPNPQVSSQLNVRNGQVNGIRPVNTISSPQNFVTPPPSSPHSQI